MEALWPRYGLDGDDVIDAAREFGRRAPLVLEIGFGMGDTLAELARRHPQVDYIGVEVHDAGIGRLLNLAATESLNNLRVIRGDAVLALEHRIAAASLDAVLIYFPDPWPKKRHHKRRLIQPAFAELVADRLRPGGRLHLASDWAPYAEHMLEVLDACAALRNEAGPGNYAPRPASRPRTKFERRGEALGHDVFDLEYVRLETTASEL